LLIGVNDWVQGVDSGAFHKNLVYILGRMQSKLPNKSNLILVTIPDFSATPTGAQYANGRDISKGITQFNDIIKKEAVQRGLPVVDIFPLTQNMKNDKTLIAQDGLHPSAKEYALWQDMIYPVAAKMLMK
jgi:acyl-CoA thioesterase-1